MIGLFPRAKGRKEEIYTLEKETGESRVWELEDRLCQVHGKCLPDSWAEGEEAVNSASLEWR